MTSPTPEEKLKAQPTCPLCGGEAGALMREGGTWRLWCLRSQNECGFIGPDRNTEREAIACCSRRSPSRKAVLEEAARVLEESAVDYERRADESATGRRYATAAYQTQAASIMDESASRIRALAEEK